MPPCGREDAIELSRIEKYLEVKARKANWMGLWAFSYCPEYSTRVDRAVGVNDMALNKIIK